MRRLLKWGVFFGFGTFVGLGTASFGQVPVPLVPPPSPEPSGAVLPTNLGTLTRAFAGDVRKLYQVIGGDLSQTDAGKYLLQDAQELAQAVDDFGDALNNTADRFGARQSFSNLDQSWRGLVAQLSQPGLNTPAIAETIQRANQDEAQLLTALNLRPLPTTYYTQTTAPTGLTDLQRLSHALADRAAALAALLQTDGPGPGWVKPIQDSVNLSAAADAFNNGIDLNAPPGVARNGFAGVDALTDTVRRDLIASTLTPRVQAAWQAFLATEILIKQQLGLVTNRAELSGTVIVENGPSPVVGLAGRLVEQVNAFLQVFSQTGAAVPEGGLFLADAQRLQAAAVNFQQDTARGLNPGQLAFEFRDVDGLWDRLARRTNRIARGRVGPNIEQVGKMGQTIAEIHSLLGIPGYPASVVIAVPAGSPR